MFLHFLLDQCDSFARNIASIVIEKIKLPQKRKKCVTYTTTQFIVVATFACKLEKLSKKCNLGHFSLEICSIFEEITFMKLIKFVPYADVN